MVELVNNVLAGPAQVKAANNKAITAYVMSLWAVILVLLLWVFVTTIGWSVSGFNNSPNNIRRYIVADDGVSLDDKINRNSKSGLTGSRDVPVFFSDFNVEMARDSDGNLNPQRESFAGEKDDVANIEQRFMIN
jgi:hypothetical protein